jgi:hypothetical protein
MGFHIVNDVNNKVKQYGDHGFVAVGMDTLFIIEAMKELKL